MSDATEQALREVSIPVPVAGAAITAFALLFVTSGYFIGLPIFGALLLLTYATRWRLPGSRWYGYALRVLLFGAVVLTVGLPREDTNFWYFKPEYTRLAGYLLAAEMVVQAWRWRDWSRPPEAAGVAILLTALIVAAGSNTYKHRQVGFFIPIYVTLLVISLRSVAVPRNPPRRRAGYLLFRALLLLAALAFGFAGVNSVTRWDYRLTKLAMQLLNRSDLRAEIGLSDAPYLGTVFNPKASMERVLVFEGAVSDPHLRAMAYDRFEGHVWRPTMGERDFVPVDDANLGIDKPGERATVTVLGDLSGLIVAPLETVGIVTDAPVSRDELGVLQWQDPASSATYAIVRGAGLWHQGPLCARPDQAERAELLTVPIEIDARVSQLAIDVAGRGSTLKRVYRLAAELKDHHRYSLRFVPQGEPISDFVLNNRAAHCEYFASAMVIMARAAGIPSRMVTGYYAHERTGNETVVRGRDAHAWAECWVDGTGWITVDATPSDGTPDAIYSPPSWARRTWDLFCDVPRLIRSKLARINRRIVLELAGAAVAVAALIALYRRLRRRGSGLTRGPYPMADATLAAFARRFERAARRLGMALPPQRTWRESLSSAPPAFKTFIQEYNTLRFGDSGDVKHLSELLEQIEKEPRKSHP